MKNVRKTVKGNFEARKMLNGCMVSAYGKSEIEALQRLSDKIQELEAQESDCITLGEWLPQWLEIYKAPTVSPKAAQRFAACIRLHIPDSLKNKLLDGIRPLDLQKALIVIPRSRTRLEVYDIYAQAFAKAYDLEIIAKNPMRKVEKVKHKRKRSKPLGKEEREELLQKVSGTRFEWLVKFYLATGVRRAEALALTWQDIDFTNEYALIRGTKTESSYRRIKLTETALQALTEQQKITGQNTTVFPWTPDYITHVFKRLCPNHHLHETRHTFATACAESGIQITTVQHWLGQCGYRDNGQRIYPRAR